MSARYALYYAPQLTHPLWRAGCEWLGRDAITGAAVERATQMQRAELERVTAVPRRYGFHATIKAPFALTPGISAQDLNIALARYARAQSTFEMPPLSVAWLGDFLALVPQTPDPQLAQVERDVVTQFDAFRAAPTHAEIRRGQGATLDSVEEDLLQRWGYPYVLERFRFHFSLTGSLGRDEENLRERLGSAARAHFAQALAVALPFDALCVFEEPERGSDFRLTTRIAFGANQSNAIE